MADQEGVLYDLGDEWGDNRDVGKGSKAKKDGFIFLMTSSTSSCVTSEQEQMEPGLLQWLGGAVQK